MVARAGAHARPAPRGLAGLCHTHLGEYKGLLAIEWLRGLHFRRIGFCEPLNGKGGMNQDLCIASRRALARLVRAERLSPAVIRG